MLAAKLLELYNAELHIDNIRTEIVALRGMLCESASSEYKTAVGGGEAGRVCRQGSGVDLKP
jgi:hypothetical protein